MMRLHEFEIQEPHTMTKEELEKEMMRLINEMSEATENLIIYNEQIGNVYGCSDNR